uniref:Uncharacterized protein n=1 Tax=Psilocybe cubensis TaxID=181762 RepID=A0A8H8CK84_PSICU
MESRPASVNEGVSGISPTAPSTVNPEHTSQSNVATSLSQPPVTSASSDFIFPANMILQYPSRTDPIIPLDLFPSPQEPQSLSDEGLTLTGRYGTGNSFSGTETGDELNTFEPSVDDNSFEDLHSEPRFSEFSIAGYDNNDASRTNNTMDLDNAYCISYAPKPMEANVFHPPQTLISGTNFAEPIIDEHRGNRYTSGIGGSTGLERTSPMYLPFSPRYSPPHTARLLYRSQYGQQKQDLYPVASDVTHLRRRHHHELTLDSTNDEERRINQRTLELEDIPVSGILPNVMLGYSPTHVQRPMKMDVDQGANGKPKRGMTRDHNPRSTKSRKKSGKSHTAAKDKVCVCQKRGVDGRGEPVKTYTGPTKSPGQGHRSDLANNWAKKCMLCHRAVE